jgi:ribonuclease III
MTAERPTSFSQRLLDLQRRLGYRFRSPPLLEQALTHSSFQGDGGGRRYCNERMEFLGDRVLGLVIADLLVRRFQGEEVGALARRHAALVRREALVVVADALELAPCLRMSRGEEEAGGRRNPGLVADACEALIAAIYLDGGLAVVQPLVERLWQSLVERDASPPKDPKTLLQEWAQGLGLALPHYREVERSGPPHAPLFQVEVCVEQLPPVVGSGTSKRYAERAAAEAMLVLLAQRHAVGAGRHESTPERPADPDDL